MAHVKYRLVSAGRPVMISNTRKVRFFNYATDDALATVVTAGYFNASRDDLSVGSVIKAVVALSGTPKLVELLVATVPTTGDVTVTQVTTLA